MTRMSEKETLSTKRRMDKEISLKSFISPEKKTLAIISVSGIIYNIGMIAGPYFEGRLAKCFYEIVKKNRTWRNMLSLAAVYLLTILLVQASRCIKRFYVRRFANNISRSMRHIIYNNIVFMNKESLDRENTGSIMTKAIADVDACAEGMRKFTTEIFDTGVVLVAYIVMLFVYDVRLAFISIIFIPIAYIIAEKLKVVVTKQNEKYKKCAGELNMSTLDRIENAITFRVYGRESRIDDEYEKVLSEYEKSATYANMWESAMQPLYNIISMCGIIFILYYGAKNVMGTGYASWDIGVYTTFISCFTKMALKSSKAANLFNAVQKARVSWKRIQPFMKECKEREDNRLVKYDIDKITVKNASFSYSDTPNSDEYIANNINFTCKKGQIVGITGEVATGKSLIGKVLIGEGSYKGSILLDNIELKNIYAKECYVTYMGHDPELMSDTISENIILDDAVCLDDMLSKNKKHSNIVGCNIYDNLYDIDKDDYDIHENSHNIAENTCNTDKSLHSIYENSEDNRYENIKYNNIKYNKVTELVCMRDEINDMSDDDNTYMGNGGIRMSGGQQARIALARTLYHAGAILVLDDPFSAVDKKTEQKIFKNIREYAKDKIIIIISHRLEIFKQFDEIVMLKSDGTAITGTHNYLMNNCKEYKTLYDIQSKVGDISE